MGNMITLPFNNTPLDAYYAAPDDLEKHPGIILIHEVWGLKDHMKDVANRFAGEGYVVITPDLLSQTGITEKIDQSILKEVMNPETRDEAQKRMRLAMAPIQSPEFGRETVEKLQTCLEYLLKDEQCNGKVAVVGFCFGGTYSYALAVADHRLSAAVPYYGHAPDPIDQVKEITCPVLAFYGEKDQNLISQVPILKEKMKEYGKDFQAVVYPNTGHAFFNDTNPTTYNKETAEDSWKKTLEFLKKNLQ